MKTCATTDNLSLLDSFSPPSFPNNNPSTSMLSYNCDNSELHTTFTRVVDVIEKEEVDEETVEVD